MVWTPAPGMAKSIVTVRPVARIGVQDRLAERAGAAVGRRVDHEDAVRDQELRRRSGCAPSDWAADGERGKDVRSRRRV